MVTSGSRSTPELAAAIRQLRDELTELRSTLAARPLLDIATGILAERLHCPPADAAAQLVSLAAQARVGIEEFAAEIVGESTERHGPASPGPTTAPARAPSAWPGHPDAQTAALGVLDHTGRQLGATGVVIWAVEPDGGLALAGAAGFPTADLHAWRRIPPGVPCPAGEVARSAEEYGPAESRHPTLGRAKAPWRTALPARRHGRLLGVLELAWPARPTDLTDAVRRRLRALTEICALSLPDRQAKRAREPGADEEPPTSLLDAVLDPAMLLQPVLGSGGEVTDFRILRVNSRFLDPEGRPPHSVENRTLIEAYPLASAGGLLVRLLHVHTTGEAIQGEELLLSFLIGELPQPTALEIAAGRTDQGLVLCWRFEESDARQAALLNNAGRLARLGGFEENLVTGAIHWNQGLYELHGLPTDAEPTPFAALPAHVHPDDEQAVRRLVRSILGQRKEASAVFRLIHPGGLTRYTRVVAEPVIDANGRLRGVQGAYQDVSAQHWTEIALSATRERLADTEQQASERHRLALRLQQAIMPPEPPPLDAAGLATAARYRPAAQEECVGGDWYDAVLLPDRTALLVVGDMAGHGIEAATGMVALRNALRGLAVTGAGPAQLLAWLNTAADALSDPATATAICARYDPASRELRWARAGHLPPLLVRGGHARLLPMPHGVLIGADPDAEYEEDTLVLEPGDVLLLYTDGLVERRDQSVEDSLCRLVDGLGDPIDDLGGFLDRLLDRSTADTDDDTSLIAVRVADGRRPAEVPGSRTEA